MIGNLDPKQMIALMKRFGVEAKEIKVEEIVIKKEGKTLISKAPQVIEINYGGKKVYQITGDFKEKEEINKEDVETLMLKYNLTKEEAEKLLKENDNDLIKAIEKIEKEGKN